MSKDKTGPVLNPFKIVTRTITRFYLVLFMVTVVGGLIIAVITLNDILSRPQTIKGTSAQINQTANQSQDELLLISRLNKFETSSSNTNFQNITPTSRPNPFSE